MNCRADDKGAGPNGLKKRLLTRPKYDLSIQEKTFTVCARRCCGAIKSGIAFVRVKEGDDGSLIFCGVITQGT